MEPKIEVHIDVQGCALCNYPSFTQCKLAASDPKALTPEQCPYVNQNHDDY